MDSKKIKSFTDLKAWQQGHKLLLEIYQVSSEFPGSHIYGLTSQIQRSSLSVTSNLAEGFGRETAPDRNKFYTTARGSIAELQNQLLVAYDLDLLTKRKFNELAKLTTDVYKLINGLIRTNRQYYGDGSRFNTQDSRLEYQGSKR